MADQLKPVPQTPVVKTASVPPSGHPDEPEATFQLGEGAEPEVPASAPTSQVIAEAKPKTPDDKAIAKAVDAKDDKATVKALDTKLGHDLDKTQS